MTSLYEKLQKSTSEEDVKDIYIKALGLKKTQKGRVDIQTDEIWFEAKDGYRTSTYEMFTQLLHYVQEWINAGLEIPPFLCVIDTRKAAIMKTIDVLQFLEKKTIKWGKSASGYTQEALDAVSAYIGTHFVSYNIEHNEEEFIETVKNAIKKWDIIRTQITPDNLKQVFDKWIEKIGKEITGVTVEDYALLFFADIMHDGTSSTHLDLPAELLYKNGSPVFSLSGHIYELGNKEWYRQFWQIYHKPPRAEYRDYLLERRDSLIPLDERSFKWAYYTPLHVVDKAYDTLRATLGENWQKEYIVWDMCCGVGNLEVKHSNPRNIYMSTLDQADIDVMKATKTCVSAERFQYDYLNDDISDDGRIDYSLTDKVPERLRKAIADGKKILVLINPPYAESASGSDTANKIWVATTLISGEMKDLGYAKRELFVQFLVRISKEIPTVTLAMFSTLKYVNAPNFEKFRESWNAEYLGGFIVHSKAFDWLNGNFPIGFLVWKTNLLAKIKIPILEISTEILDKNAQAIGEKKFYNLSTTRFLGEWIIRKKANTTGVIPLKNAVTPASNVKDLRGTMWSENAIASMLVNSSDVQHANLTALLSSGYSSPGAFFVTPENLWQAVIVFTVRRLIKPTWINDRDQFLQPTGELTDEFKSDCLIWTLFNWSNLTASANDLEWNDRKWSIVNHFIPFTEAEVGSPERFESDFMVEYLSNKKLSPEAQVVIDEGRNLWRAYFSQVDTHTIREEYRLNRSDVGWYQIRNALKKRSENGDGMPVSFTNFEKSYRSLTEKLRPMVYELGFLRV